MKKFPLLMAMVLIGLTSTAQQDTLPASINKADTTQPVAKNDTIRVGNILIIKRNKKSTDSDNESTEVVMSRNAKRKTNSKVETNWGVLDLGFSNYNDQTNYGATGAYLVNKPGTPAFGEGDFKLRSNKSINVNIWFFMQRLSLVKSYVNLKYGLGLELNNYGYKANISHKEDGPIPYSGNIQTSSAFIFEDSISFSKNKLAADYLTVPFMINFTSHPQSSKKGVSLSLGASAGYLYSQRNKQKSDERGKQKNRGEYDLEKFKLSYVAELGLGPVRLYGSYSPKSMYENSLDLRPFTVGFRFSNL